MASGSVEPIVKRKIMTTTLVDHSKRLRIDETHTDSDPFSPSITTSSTSNETPKTENTVKLHNQITFRMDEILPANGKISIIYARNYLGTNNQHSCRLQTESRNSEKIWSSMVLTHIHYLTANRQHVVMASQGGELFCYSTISGSIQISLRLEHSISRLILNNHYCAIHQSNDEIVVRNLKYKTNVVRYALPTNARKSEVFSSFILSQHGLPIIFLSSGDFWFFSERESGWQQIQTSIDVLTNLSTYLDFIQKAAPDGLISKIVINRGQLKPSSLTDALVAESREEELMECLLNALDELNYAKEYALLASIYVSRLVSRGKVHRLYSYKESLTNSIGKSNVKGEEVLTEIKSQLEKYPQIQQALEELPEKMKEELYVEEDLGFLDT